MNNYKFVSLKTLKHFFLYLFLFNVLVTASYKMERLGSYGDTWESSNKGSYVVGPGDELKLFFMISQYDSGTSYEIQVGDEFNVIFYLNPELDKNVKVLPDSTIILVPVGSIKAAGRSFKELTDSINSRFSSTLSDPLVLIKPEKLYQTSAELINSLSPTVPQGLQISVTPDGYLFLPHCCRLQATGQTFEQLEDTISKLYGYLYPGIQVSTVLSNTMNNNVFILGEIGKPGSYNCNETNSVLSLLAKSQINLDNAGLRTVLLIRKNPDGSPSTTVINVRSILKHGNLRYNLQLKQGDIVYIPKKPIAKADLFVKQYINDLIPQIFRIGWSFGISTIIGNQYP